MTPVKPYQQKIIGLYVQQELKLAELYTILSETVPSLHAEFTSMRNDELAHAQWVEYFGRVAEQGGVPFHENATRTYTVQAFLDHVAAVIKRAGESSQTPREALAIAISMEEALLERRVFDHFQGDSPDVARVLKRLRKETADHLAMVRELAKKTRNT